MQTRSGPRFNLRERQKSLSSIRQYRNGRLTPYYVKYNSINNNNYQNDKGRHFQWREAPITVTAVEKAY